LPAHFIAQLLLLYGFALYPTGRLFRARMTGRTGGYILLVLMNCWRYIGYNTWIQVMLTANNGSLYLPDKNGQDILYH
jgi:hypothetical protein